MNATEQCHCILTMKLKNDPVPKCVPDKISVVFIHALMLTLVFLLWPKPLRKPPQQLHEPCTGAPHAAYHTPPSITLSHIYICKYIRV